MKDTYGDEDYQTTYTNEVHETRARILAAAANDFEVIHGNATTLLVDIDSPTLVLHTTVLEIINRKVGITYIYRWRSKTKGWHYQIGLLNPLVSCPARIALQAALGSDPVREALAIELYEKGCPEEDVSVLFKPPHSQITSVSVPSSPRPPRNPHADVVWASVDIVGK